MKIRKEASSGDHHEVQIKIRISSSSSIENPSTFSLLNLMSVISCMTFGFQLSSSAIGWYLIVFISQVSTCSGPHIRFDCVQDMLDNDFGDFFTWLMKLRNRLTSTSFTWFVPVIGLIRYLCVANARSNAILTFLFQQLSICSATSENRFQRGEPVKCEQKIWLTWNLGWEK